MNLTTFRFVVITGILSFAIGARADYSKERVPSYLRALGFPNTTLADIEKYDEEMCRKISGPNAYENQKQSWQASSTCVMSVAREAVDEVRNRSSSLTPFTEMASLKSYCRRVPKFENCLRNLTESVKTCFDPEKHEHVNIIYNTLSSTMRYLCEDGGIHLAEFFLTNGQRCLSSKQLDIIACTNQTVIKHIQATITNGAAIGGLGGLHLLAPDRDKCTVLNDFQHCTIGALRNCEQSAPASLTDSLFNIVKKEATCDRWFKSRASPIRVVNFLLITAITVISLRSAYE